MKAFAKVLFSLFFCVLLSSCFFFGSELSEVDRVRQSAWYTEQLEWYKSVESEQFKEPAIWVGKIKEVIFDQQTNQIQQILIYDGTCLKPRSMFNIFKNEDIRFLTKADSFKNELPEKDQFWAFSAIKGLRGPYYIHKAVKVDENLTLEEE